MKKLFLTIFLFLTSCQKEVNNLDFRIYTIPKGKHSSGTFVNHPENSRIIFDFILSLEDIGLYISQRPSLL